MNQKNRLSQIGNIRALAIFLVVLGHSIILYSYSWNLYETSRDVPFLNYLKQIIDIPQMPLFFSLSGYLFVFTHTKQRGFFHLLKSKALRLLVPYIGIGLCFLLPIRVAIGLPSYQNISLKQLAVNFLTSSDVGHLWFLPALFFVFIVSELILMVAQKIPGIKKHPELFLGFVALTLYMEGYRIGFGYPPLLTSFNYLLWFSVGYTVNIWQNTLKKIYAIKPLAWMLVIINLALLAYSVAFGPVRVMLSLLTKALCIVNAYGAIPESNYKITEKIDQNSFGIYLFHSPLIYITYANIPDAHPAIVVFINLIICGVAAYYLTDLLRKTKLKLLIGE